MRFFGGSSAFFGQADSAAFYAGGGVSALVPDTYTVALSGRPYMIDLSQPFYRQYRRQLAPLIRTQADTQKLPGEHSLDPNGLWRRSFEDWSLGAGQRYLDRDTSIDNGFWQSKGIDALTSKWQINLLPDTASQQSSTNTNLAVVEANGYIYIADGQTLLFTNSLSGSVSWTTVTGTPADDISSIASDGKTVYVAYGAGGLYTTTAGGSSASQYVTSTLGASAVVGYVNGRLMVGDGASLYNVIATGALPTALLTTNNTNTTWVGFAEGNNQLYAAANVGTKALIYGTAAIDESGALTAPTVQGQLPNGESVTSVLGYLGQLIIGTSLGVRYATLSSTGAVSIGALITGSVSNSYGPTASVQCLAGYQRWVWFGWTDYDGTSTGLGRIDLENFVIAGVLPAFASDLMATGQGAVTGVANLGGTTIFAVSGKGFYVQSTDLVSSGTITSGYVLFDLADPKIASLLDVQTVGALTEGSYSAAVSADGGSYSTVGTQHVGDPEPATFGIPGTAGERFEIQLTLNRDSTTTTAGPAITRWTLRVYPAPRRPITWQLPLVFDEEIINTSGMSAAFDPLVELAALEQMAANGLAVSYQEANQSYQVFVQDVQFLPDQLTEDKHYFNGLCLVTLESLPVPYVGS